jgi:hypothetical protein
MLGFEVGVQRLEFNVKSLAFSIYDIGFGI